MAGSADGAAEVDARIADMGDDWRARTLTHLRALIREAEPQVVEAVQWRKPTNPAGVPTWSRSGMICTGETYRDKVKLTFAYGASLPDPAGVFNAGFGGGTRRAIDLKEGAEVDAEAFRTLVRAAVERNAAKRGG